MAILFDVDSDEQYDSNGLPHIASKSFTNSFFYHHNYTNDNFWTFEPGIRFNYYRNMEISLPKSNTSDSLDIAPRFSIRRQLDFNSNVYFSTGRFYQYLALETEVYYKTYDNIMEYNMATDAQWDNSTMTMADAFHQGKGQSFGVN